MPSKLENPSTPSGVLKLGAGQGGHPPDQLENPSTPSGVLKLWKMADTAQLVLSISRKPLNTLRGIETFHFMGLVSPKGDQSLENPSTPSGVLKRYVKRLGNQSLGAVTLENPSTPSGVLKRTNRCLSRPGPGFVGSKTPQHPPGY